jgi:hypothetical protein
MLEEVARSMVPLLAMQVGQFPRAPNFHLNINSAHAVL